jgi:tetratricopeptide (TPR) repeat protein
VNDDAKVDGSDVSGLDRSFAAAMAAAERAPESVEAWDHLEELAEKLNRADEVAGLYRGLIEQKLAPPLLAAVGQRAVAFHESWFGDTPERITDLLERITAIDPEAAWAFERLTVMLTSAGRWDALLEAYDRAIARTGEPERKRRLLDDAAQAAKDFADQPDRAADYLRQLVALEPDNAALVGSLERLLERGHRWRDLVALWEGQIATEDASARRDTRLRIARCWLEQLSEPQRAVEVLRDLFVESPGHLEACQLLEAVLGLDGAELATRRQALSLLRKHYLVADRPEDVVRVLESALVFVEHEERRPIHRELGTRLAILGRDEEAMAQYGALLLEDPSDADARKQLRQLAGRSGRHDLHAEALVAAADACADPSRRATVWIDAAHVHQRDLGDSTGAIALFRRVLEAEEADPAAALAAAHALDELLDHEAMRADRLAVLERLASLERSTSVRRSALAEAARIAEALGDDTRALASWQPVLAQDPRDLEALDAVISLLERAGRHDELATMIARRAEAAPLPLQRRADRVRLATLHADGGQADEAIDIWLSIREEFGDAPDVTAALDALMSAGGRFDELARIMREAAAVARARDVVLFRRLGEIYLGPLQSPGDALPWLMAALAAAPDDEGSRRSTRSLLAHGPSAHAAGEALMRAFEATGDWRAIVEVLDQRLGSARDRSEQASILRQTARLHLERGDDPASALGCLCRALPLEPDNLATEAEMMRLADETARWTTVAASLRMAAEGASPARAAELRRTEGAIQERRLEDAAAALEAYRGAVAIRSDDLEALEAIVRCASRAHSWGEATQAAVTAVALRDRIRPEVVSALEVGAADADDWASLASSLGVALGDRRLSPAVAQGLEAVVARWFRDHVGDLEAAIRAAQRAAQVAGPGRFEALALLADLQRSQRHEGLVATLLELDRLADASLDPLKEAAEASLMRPEAPQILERLHRKAAGMWLRGEAASGTVDPPTATRWALERLLEQVAGSPERAIEVMLDATRLPLSAEEAVDLRRRAAELLVEHGDRGRAIDVYRGVLERRPRDVEALQRVASLCEAEGRLAEALALRLREIDLVDDPDRRLELRLAHARLTGGLEAQGGRVASLRANLVDRPGHEASIDELAQVLEERGKHVDLATILAEQAAELEARGERARAADLFARVAATAAGPLGDRARAIEAHGRVVELDARADSIDALARLHLESDPAEAARWLERRLELTAASERISVLLRLARARIRAGEREAAVASLRKAFDEAPRNAEVRKLLLELHRQGRDHEALAETLTRAALAVSDGRTVLTYAREAAALYRDRLDAPARAVPVLAKAVELSPDDRELRLMLAEGLRAAGELAEARALLEGLVVAHGRRRSPERAQTHLELARVLHAEGDDTRALDELDVASSMAPGDATILVTLAELASDSGQLDRAERAYRTLLVSARREAGLPVGPAEILFQLSHLAAARGHGDKARELVESALEALAQRDDEAARVQAKLRTRGDLELLERVLRHRLGHVTAPHKRATVLGELADLLSELERSSEALAVRLQAVEIDPSSPLHHQAAWDAASAAGNLDAYVSVVEALLSDERADRSAHVRCELLLRLGEVLEKERGDLDRAAALYAQAESTGVRAVDVWRSQARVAGQRGDSQSQVRLLEQLANLGEAEAETRSDALYRLAEVQLASADAIEDGLGTLEKALADDFRAERAALVLRPASEAHPNHAALLDVYEPVARRSGDDDTLLHYLSRRAASDAATTDQVREAVDLARRLERFDEAEALMLRAAEIGKSGAREGDLAEVDWALLGLAERRMAASDLPGAVRWLVEAADVADLDAVFALAEALAELAAEGDLTLAAKLYERLLERAPTERRAWRPLAEICGRLGDVERLERIVEETLDGLPDPAERQSLRVALARALLAHDDRHADAVATLEQVLADDPEAREAQALLVAHLERTGQTGALVDLLERQLARAIGRGDAGTVSDTARALADRLDASPAIEALRRALAAAPDDPALVEALLGRLEGEETERERAELLARLLRIGDADRAGERALTLAQLQRDLGDAEAAVRALEVGLERAPEHDGVREALLSSYRDRGDHAGLVRVLLAAAERSEEPTARAMLLREAATVRRGELGDPAGAAELLRQASELSPAADLRLELAQTLGEAGAHEAAIEVVSAAIDREPSPDLLGMRAGLLAASGRHDAALEDRERAYERAPATAPALEEALLARREAAIEARDETAERQATLRAVEVMLARGERERASALIADHTRRAPDDVEALRRQRDLDTADGRWRAVAATCRRLVELEHGPAQIDAALGLSHACHELEEPEAAREGLEHVRRVQPSPQVRSELRRIYARLGDQHQLARLLVEDAGELEDVTERSELLGHAGRILVDLGAVAEAVPPLEEALRLAPGAPESTVTLADAYLLDGRLADAERLLAESIAAGRGRRTPEMALYYHRKATIAGERGELGAQLELLQEAHGCNKKYGLAAAALADLAEQLGDLDLAAKTLRTITLIDSECPITRAEAFLRQGRIAKRQGDDKSARMWARRAKREDPDDPQVDAFLAAVGERTSVMPGRG